MSQQINLFNPIFLKQKKYFSAVTMAQALGLVLVGSLMVSAYANYQLSLLKNDAQAAKAQLAQVQGQLNKVNAAYAPRQKSKAIDDELRKTESDIASLQQVFDVLQKGEFGNTKGYAEYLRAFSRQIVNGVWLTGFNLVGAGSEIALQGRALQPDLVPAYISRLRREPVLQGTSFAALDMKAGQDERNDKGQPAADRQPQQASQAPYIEFSLQSAGMANESAESSGARKQ